MTDRRPPGEGGIGGEAPRVQDLHRLEDSARDDHRAGGGRRHTDVATVAGLDVATRPAVAAGPASLRQQGSEPVGPKRAGRGRSAATWSRRGLGLLGILGFLGTWQLLPTLGIVNPAYMPTATEAIGQLFRSMGLTSFWVAVGDTLYQWLIGMAIAVVAAAVLGFIIGSSTFLRRFTNSTIEFMRPVPSVALIPLAVLVFGVSTESSVMLIVYACFWQVLIQVLYGVADVDTVAMNTARSYGLGRFAQLRWVVFPTTLPYLMTGIRLASAVALILAVTAQLIIGVDGLGQEIANAQSGGNYVAMYALVLATGLLGVLINTVMRVAERLVLSWHSSVRTEAVS